MTFDDQGRHFKFVIGDRDTKSVETFDTVFAADGTRVIKTPPSSPQANAYPELAAGIVERKQSQQWDTCCHPPRHAEP